MIRLPPASWFILVMQAALFVLAVVNIGLLVSTRAMREDQVREIVRQEFARTPPTITLSMPAEAAQ